MALGEACWRLQGNELAARLPTISRLTVHLPDQQYACYDPNKNDESQEILDKNKRTKLTAYFELNQQDEDACGLYYRQIPECYRWDTDKRMWMTRKRETNGIPKQIGRMYSIHPRQQELYNLRLLLNNVKGAEGFDDLKNFQGVTHETYQSAAVARNLVKNDMIWIECMNEANETETNIHRLRKLFVAILTQCEVGDPISFYKECTGYIKHDYEHQYKVFFDRHPHLNHFLQDQHQDKISTSDDSLLDDDSDSSDQELWTLEMYALNSCLCDLEKLLSEQDQSLSTFGLPAPDLEREQLIQNCLMDSYVVNDDDELSPETAKIFLWKLFKT